MTIALRSQPVRIAAAGAGLTLALLTAAGLGVLLPLWLIAVRLARR